MSLDLLRLERRGRPAGGAAPAAAPPGSAPTPATPEPVARLRDVTVTFRRGGRAVQAVRGASLDIAPGEIVALVGESGSGKTVLSMSMLGLLPASARPEVGGTIEVCGVDVARAAPAEVRALRRTHLGAVFQDPMTSLNPTMRIGRQLREVVASDDEAVALLDAVGIPSARSRLRSYPHELSGGQRQRVMIAMAVAGEPRLVVADEPTTALDVTVQAQVLDLVRDLRERIGCSFVFITHDLGVGSAIADRVVVMYGGRLVEVGPAGAVLETPSHPYGAALRAARLTLRSDRSGPVPALPGEPPDPTAADEGCAFAPRCPAADETCRAVVPALRPAAAHGGLVACHHPDAGAVDVVATEPWPVAVRPPGRYALEVADLVRTFPARGRRGEEIRAVDGVDLRVGPGEVVAVVGESGSGKSTLLRIVAGLDRATSGQVALAPDVVPQMVFQDPGASLTPWLTVGELVGERLLAQGRRRRDVRGDVAVALGRVGLPAEVASARPTELSGGQRQRVALARSLIVPPRLLLCDEPTSALDASLAASTLNALGSLRRELGMAMLFVTHDLAVARLVADRVVVMRHGRIVEEVAAADLATVGHEYSRALLAAIPGESPRPQEDPR